MAMYTGKTMFAQLMDFYLGRLFPGLSSGTAEIAGFERFLAPSNTGPWPLPN
jgi:hypothetical protein